jgi:hypothetical protein
MAKPSFASQMEFASPRRPQEESRIMQAAPEPAKLRRYRMAKPGKKAGVLSRKEGFKSSR